MVVRKLYHDLLPPLRPLGVCLFLYRSFMDRWCRHIWLFVLCCMQESRIEQVESEALHLQEALSRALTGEQDAKSRLESLEAGM